MSHRRRTHLLALVAVVAPALVAACGEKAKPLPGKSCTLNSECNDPLSCTFGRCHATCAETRDCPLGQRLRERRQRQRLPVARREDVPAHADVHGAAHLRGGSPVPRTLRDGG